MIYPREDGITSNGGKGGDNRNRRRPFRRGSRDNDSRQENQGRQNQGTAHGNSGNSRTSNDNSRFERNKGVMFDRPKWTPPQAPSEPLPVPDCPWCGKPIKDIASAIADKDSGVPVHFDCVIARLSEGEILEKGDAVSYIGGGRFGIVHYLNPQDMRNFTIKKIFEWENKENRAEWRSTVCDHYSVT
ncbi:conserved hypothetical protein [Leadbettera azotonutricia ZAS-9]|uniref:Uncharacterized protein n=1 Tax=Leadbettera azotonutricia (strain ATCC BAA-888 / DSM 13862 / ZAS-9) TaxID=545695 RepID=F5YFP6_LEAAZ|nr:conserved hypothetical protein [Leadbettera azotonutricia ZAS-9]